MASNEAPTTTAPPKWRVDRELSFLEALYKIDDIGKEPMENSVKTYMEMLQNVFNKYQMDEVAETPAGKAKQLVAKQKSSLYALRRIVTAWNKYPVIGSDYNTTKTSAYDFRNTALHVVKDTPVGSLERELATSMATTVDQIPDGDEPPQKTQARIENLINAAKKQYYIWIQDMIVEETMTDYERSDHTLSEDEADTVTYTMQKGQDTLNPPSNPAKMLPQTAEADNELDDRQIIYTAGRVLRTKADKIGYASEQAKEAAAKAKIDRDAAKAAASAAKAKAFRNTTTSDAESDNADTPLPTTTPAKKGRSATKKRAASASEGSSPIKRPRLRKLAPKPADQSISKENDGGDTGNLLVTVAPDQTKPGGAAKPWLRDEDDWGHQAILDNPDWPMPTIYRELNQRFANTAFQDASMPHHAYRSDYVRFPIANPKKDNKKTRDYDLFHRSYQSVRQHFEKFKREVMLKPPTPPTWEPFPENLAANLPARPAPPRPDVFRDPDQTPMPRVGEDPTPPTAGPRARARKGKVVVKTPATLGGEDDDVDDEASDMEDELSTESRSALEAGASSNGAPSSAPSPNRSVHTFNGEQYYQTRGWTPINAPVSGNHTAYSPPAPRRGDRAAAERCAGLLSTIDPRARMDMTDPKNFGRKYGQAAKPKTLPKRQTQLQFLQPMTLETMRNSGAQEASSVSESGKSAPGDALVDSIEDFVAQQSDGEEDVQEVRKSLIVVLKVPGGGVVQPTQSTNPFQRYYHDRNAVGARIIPGSMTPHGGFIALPAAPAPRPSAIAESVIVRREYVLPLRLTTGRAITLRPHQQNAYAQAVEKRDADAAAAARRQVETIEEIEE
ncbi:hypothetical protein Q7P37_002349 [Cladosporium fusiforme]